MRILLVSPARKDAEGDFWEFRFTSFLRGAPLRVTPFLALPTLAAMCPPDDEVSIVDDAVSPIPFEEAWDLVGVTTNTCLSARAYEIADEFRRRGRRVVLGGIHPSLVPEEALAHADAVVVGEAEEVMPDLLADARASALKRRYSAGSFCDLSRSASPRWDLVSMSFYSNPLVQTSRGCPHDCEFCSVRAFLGRKYRWKTLERVLEEVRALKALGKETFFWADDNLIANKERIRSILREVAALKVNFYAQVTSDLAEDGELLEALAGAGCKRVVIGFESLSDAALRSMKKAASNRADKYPEQVRKIQSAGIEVLGSFIFGFDGDEPSVFRRTAEFVLETGMSLATFNVLTPYPGTVVWSRLEEQGRILSRDWSLYDGTHVVFKPARMSPEELEEGYRWVRKEVFSYDSIFRRLETLWGSWNSTGARKWDRVSPILVNLEAHAAAFGFSPTKSSSQ